MTSTLSAMPLTDQQEAVPPALAALRAELDRIDDAIHALLRERAEVVGAVGGTKAGVALRPGREAAILRRLLAGHRGALPGSALVRIWRELFAATTSLQGNFLVAVCETDPGNAMIAGAREHFGALTPLHAHRSPAQSIAEVSSGRAAAAVLPLPDQESAVGGWWTALLAKDEPRIHIVARLPFWGPRPEGATRAEALVVSAVAPDPSGDDRSLIGIELPQDFARSRLMDAVAAAGFAASDLLVRRDASVALIDVAGFVTDDDPRLAAIAGLPRPPVVLGVYACPLSEATP